MKALVGQPWHLPVLYLAFRRKMDFRTGIVGEKDRINEVWLRTALEVKSQRGRHKPQPVSRKFYRSAVDALVRLGLLTRLSDDLVFKCNLALTDQSVQTMRGRSGADEGPDEGPTKGQTKALDDNALEHRRVDQGPSQIRSGSDEGPISGTPDKSLRHTSRRRDARDLAPKNGAKSPVGDSVVPFKQRTPQIPFSKIVETYNSTLGDVLPRCEKLTETRKGYIRQRWLDGDIDSLEAWEGYFRYVRNRCPFLLGKVTGQGDRPPFRADIAWLCKPNNYAKVLEGRYER